MSDPSRGLGSLRPLWIMGGAALLLGLIVAGLPNASKPSRTGDFRIVCTFLPVYVFALNVVGDAPGVSVELLLDPTTGCPHDYAVRPGDLRKVADAQLVLANGLGLDDFIGDLAPDTKARIVRISEGIEPITKPDEHGHVHTAACTGHHHDHSPENPHVWVAPELAVRQVENLATALAGADPSRAEQYRRNAAQYVERLHALTGDMKEASGHFRERRIVTFHDAFAYLARSLNLEVVATLTVDPEQMPSAQGITSVVEQIRQAKPAAIFYEPAYSERLARTVSSETGVPMFPLNPFNTVEGVPGPRSYEQVMERNLATLKQALGGAS